MTSKFTRRLVPGGAGNRRQIPRTGVGVLAAAILILEPQLERLRAVESFECPIERRRGTDTKRRSGNACWLIDFEQRHEGRRLLPLAAKHDGRLTVTLDDPFRRAETVPMHSRRGLDL